MPSSARCRERRLRMRFAALNPARWPPPSSTSRSWHGRRPHHQRARPRQALAYSPEQPNPGRTTHLSYGGVSTTLMLPSPCPRPGPSPSPRSPRSRSRTRSALASPTRSPSPSKAGVAVVSPPAVAAGGLVCRGWRSTAQVRAAHRAERVHHHLGLAGWKARYPDAPIFAPAPRSIARLEQQHEARRHPPPRRGVEARSAISVEALRHAPLQDGRGPRALAHRGRLGLVRHRRAMFNTARAAEGALRAVPASGRRAAPASRRNPLNFVSMVKDKRALYAWLVEQAEKTPPQLVLACHTASIMLADPPGGFGRRSSLDTAASSGRTTRVCRRTPKSAMSATLRRTARACSLEQTRIDLPTPETDEANHPGLGRWVSVVHRAPAHFGQTEASTSAGIRIEQSGEASLLRAEDQGHDRLVEDVSTTTPSPSHVRLSRMMRPSTAR